MGWPVAIDIGVLSLLLGIATLARAKVPFLQRYLVPNGMTAGILGMFLWNLAPSSWGFSAERLGAYVYHLLGVTMVAMALRATKRKGGRMALANGLGFVAAYAYQALTGLVLTILLMRTCCPDLFNGFGLLLPLGYGQGPGQAYTIGLQLEKNYGFEGGANVGLAFAAAGYLWACFGGVAIVNAGIRAGIAGVGKGTRLPPEIRTGVVRREKRREVAGYLTTASEAIDAAAVNLALVGIVYLCAWFLTRGIVEGLLLVGMPARDAASFWGFTFVFALVLAMLARRLADRTGISVVIDDGLMSRIAGVCVDFTVVAALAAISFPVLVRYAVPFSVIAIAGGIVTTVVVVWSGKRGFDDHPFARMIGMYGTMTGTIPTGLALVRIVDPRFSTTVAEDLVYGSGFALALGFPLILLIGLPGRDYGTGSMVHTWWTLGAIAAYLAAVVLASRLSGILRFRRPLFSLWPKD